MRLLLKSKIQNPKSTSPTGFTIIELLITLFIAAAFLMSGHQLYGAIIKDGGETRAKSRANNVAYEQLLIYKEKAVSPCFIPTDLPTDDDITISGISNPKITVTFSCPYESLPTPITSVTKISVNIKYGTPQQEVVIATYVTI